jgi:hypothetical protein
LARAAGIEHSLRRGVHQVYAALPSVFIREIELDRGLLSRPVTRLFSASTSPHIDPSINAALSSAEAPIVDEVGGGAVKDWATVET